MIAVLCGLSATTLTIWALCNRRMHLQRVRVLVSNKSDNQQKKDQRFVSVLSNRLLWNKLETFEPVVRLRLSNEEKYWLTVGVVLGLFTAVLFPFAGFMLPTLSIAFVWHARRSARITYHRAIVKELPLTVDLLRLGVQSGLNVTSAITHVVAHTSGPLSIALGEVLEQVAKGRGLAVALEGVTERTCDEIRPLIWALTATERYGAPLADVLERLAFETRADQERRSEQAAKRLTVQLLFPVAGAILPAFALLTVAPLLAGTLTRLASSFNP